MKRALLIFALALVALTVVLGVRALLSTSGQSQAIFRWAIPASGSIAGWQASSGVLSSDGTAPVTALAAYTVPAHTNFAVQAMLRGISPGMSGAALNGFGLMVRERATDLHTSVAGGSFFDGDFQANQENNGPELYWNGQTLGAASFQPGNAWHLYRLAVQGDQYTLSIDGKQLVSSAIPDYPSPTAVGVFSWYYRVQVKQLEVDPIGPASTRVSLDLIPRTANLTVGDLPTTGFYRQYLSHWYTNEETAREGSTSLASLQASGRLASYAVDFFPSSRDFADIYSSITAFHTATQAQAYFRQRLPQLLQAATLLPNARNVADLTGLGLGEASGGFRADGSAQGINTRVIVIFFVRGQYTVLLRVHTDPDPGWAPNAARSVRQVTALGRIIDGRLPRV
jgi:hypothetical protein